MRIQPPSSSKILGASCPEALAPFDIILAALDCREFSGRLWDVLRGPYLWVPVIRDLLQTSAATASHAYYYILRVKQLQEFRGYTGVILG